jgi:hypothetical protein
MLPFSAVRSVMRRNNNNKKKKKKKKAVNCIKRPKLLVNLKSWTYRPA